MLYKRDIHTIIWLFIQVYKENMVGSTDYLIDPFIVQLKQIAVREFCYEMSNAKNTNESMNCYSIGRTR